MSEQAPDDKQPPESGVDRYLRLLGIDPSQEPEYTEIDITENPGEPPTQ